MFSLLATLAAIPLSWSTGSAAPDAPEEMRQFEFLVGCFEVDVSMWHEKDNDWGPVVRGEFRGRWGMQGWSVYDEWSGLQNPGQPDHLGHGADTRIYDPQSKRWVIAWTHNAVPGSRDRRARRNGNKIRVWQPFPQVSPAWEAQFEVGDDGNWSRTDLHSDDGETWTPERLMQARRVSCH